MFLSYISLGFCTLYFVALSQAQFHGEALKFKLSAINLPNCDLDGPSDPYVKLFTFVPRYGHRHRNWDRFGRSATRRDTLNPVWDDVFIFQYINGTNQRWKFEVCDQDDTWLNPWDDPLGKVEINVEDYLLELRKSKQNQNGTDDKNIKPIQVFLTDPIGGALFITPVSN